MTDSTPPLCLFLSASVPDPNKSYRRSDVHRLTAHPQRIRDAVLAVARATLRQGFGIVFGAHPVISPMVLDVAREYPFEAPRIYVYQSRFFAGSFPLETMELADGVLGAMCEIEAAPSPPASSDREASLLVMRERMLAHRGLAAGIFVGGMNGVLDEAELFWSAHGNRLPAYAIASVGGAARDLFDDPNRGHAETDFSGGSIAPIAPQELRAPRAGYTRLARDIWNRIEVARKGGILKPLP